MPGLAFGTRQGLILSQNNLSSNSISYQKNRYALYYGWLIADAPGNPNEAAIALANSIPKILIANYYTQSPKLANLSTPVQNLFRAQGTLIYAYVATTYGNRDIALVKAEALEYITGGGVDGIFFDEAYNFMEGPNNHHLTYYQSLYSWMQEQGRQTILNVGIGQPGERAMTATDILMVEHDWRNLYQNNTWFHNYSPERFMGISSNEAAGFFPYTVDETTAIRDTKEAWAHNVAWHYSTDLYTTLPSWFSTYIAGVQ